MKKIKFIFMFVMFLMLVFVVTACNKTTTTTIADTTTSSTTTITNVPTTIVPSTTTLIPSSTNVTTTVPTDPFEGVSVEDQVVFYDGDQHFPEVTNLPEGATVKYNPAWGYSNCGEYTFKTTVTINGQSKTFNSKLSIEKITPVLTAQEEQTFYLTDGVVKIESQTSPSRLNVYQSVTDFSKVGTYDVELYVKSTSTYNESNRVTVKVNILESRFDVSFPSKTYILTDSNPVVLDKNEIQGIESIGSEYKAELSQSTFDAQGVYQVSLNIYNTSTDDLVESHNAIITIDYPDNEDFKAYEDEMFVYFMEGDQIANNIYFTDYTKFGLEHSEAKWYTFTEYSDEDFAHDQNEVLELRKEYDSFKDAKLSFNQINTYREINGNIKYYELMLSNSDFTYMTLSYVDQYGGYISEMPTEMEAYTIRRLEDVTDIISYIDSTYDAFMSYYNYILVKEKKGYGLSEFTLDNFCEYLEGIIEKGDDYYLIEKLEDKIKDSKELLELTDEQVNEYVEALDKAFKEKFLPAINELDTKVREYIEESKKEGGYLANFKEGYLSLYENGTELYKGMLENKLGIYNTDIDEFIKIVDNALSKYLSKYISAARAITSKQESIADGKEEVIMPSQPLDLIEFLKEFAKTIVPDLNSTPEIDVTYMDETETENTTTVAYYMKSALDSDLKEYIHLNGKALGTDKVDTIKTLAHEGYPGHLYAYVATKENENLSNYVRCMTNTGFGEGWAKYVEIALGDYLANYKKNVDWKAAMEYLKWYDLFAFCLYTRVDIGISYQGWTVSDIKTYLDKQGLNGSMAKDLFQTLIEIPTQYDTYGYGQLLFYELHEEAKAKLGGFYDEVDFNRALLEHGWISLDYLKEYMNEYIDNQMFLHHLK